MEEAIKVGQQSGKFKNCRETPGTGVEEMGPRVGQSAQGECSRLVASVGKRITSNGMRQHVKSSILGVKNMKKRRRTADSASVMICCDFSFSFLSCVPRAISKARSRKFSTWRAEICALSSSIRTLRPED